MIETINLIKDLKIYNAHVLAYPEIGNTEVIRDEFISDTGLIFYSKKRSALTPISFSIEFKGDKKEIRKNRNELSKKLELCAITFDNEVFYRGRFLSKDVETRYFYQNIIYEGQAIAMLNTQYNEIPIGEKTTIYNNGNLPTPCRVIFKGSGSNISLKGFEDPININSLNGELIIDAEKGVNKLGNIEFISLPYIDNVLELNLTGSGDFKCFVEFEGRVLC
ncbi:hypothetical protein [Anaerococcus sp.]|uniref:hypothetical protein n=1 Tax=Anaerococcus sp. TaxID=1872515 RepID=UPI002A918619|nr:hypothetical protein [Anaerococcus sp.]MDY6127408.1 hypothetical protein [Anaerococcus sp.]